MRKIILSAFVIVIAGYTECFAGAEAITKPSTYLYPVKDHVTIIEKIIVSSIAAGSPLDIAGMKKGDQILSVDSKVFTVAENFTKYILERSGVAEFKIKREREEIIIKAKPKKKAPKFGLSVYYFNKEGKQVFPSWLTYSEDTTSKNKNSTVVDSISQERKNSSIGCAMALFGRALFVRVWIKNQSGRVLEFGIDESIHVASKSGLLFERISEPQVTSLANVQPNAVTVSANKYNIPTDTAKDMTLYFDIGDVELKDSLPFIAKIKVGDDQYEFRFSAERNISFKNAHS